MKNWEFDDSTEWISPEDMLLCEAIVARAAERSDQVSVCEIGVWKGGWISAILRSEPGSLGVGIDPYPGWLQDVMGETLTRFADMGLESRFRLYPSHAEFCSTTCSNGQHVKFEVIHVDGMHTEKAVEADLEFARDHLSALGVIVVDDFRHESFPGVASAMYGFVRSEPFSLFLVTDHKAFISPRKSHNLWTDDAVDILVHSNLRWCRWNGEGDLNDPYAQKTTVQGGDVLLCVGPENASLALVGVTRPGEPAPREGAFPAQEPTRAEEAAERARLTDEATASVPMIAVASHAPTEEVHANPAPITQRRLHVQRWRRRVAGHPVVVGLAVVGVIGATSGGYLLGRYRCGSLT